MRGVVWGLVLGAIGSAAAAGPWLREEGALFLSFGQNMALSDGARLPVNVDPNAYAEWGATERLTLAFSLYSGDAGRETTLETRALSALALPEGWGVASVYSGLGARRIEGEGGTEPLLLGGIAWGLGLETGWIAAEVQLTVEPRTGDAEGKVDLTWGHSWTDRWAGYVTLTAGEGHTGDFYAKVAPTAILRLSDRTRLTFGVTQALTGDKGTGLTIGSWLEF